MTDQQRTALALAKYHAANAKLDRYKSKMAPAAPTNGSSNNNYNNQNNNNINNGGGSGGGGGGHVRVTKHMSASYSAAYKAEQLKKLKVLEVEALERKLDLAHTVARMRRQAYEATQSRLREREDSDQKAFGSEYGDIIGSIVGERHETPAKQFELMRGCRCATATAGGGAAAAAAGGGGAAAGTAAGTAAAGAVTKQSTACYVYCLKGSNAQILGKGN
jgi:hypothetical protein